MAVSVGTLFVVGCSTTTFTSAEAPRAPTPKSVTRAQPGGDASDPELAALERLAAEPRGQRGDRFGTLKVPLFDWKQWQRVRLWAAPTRATFQYGDAKYAFNAVWYVKSEGDASDVDTCLDAFEKKARPVVDGYGVRVVETRSLRTRQDAGGELRPMVVKLYEGSIDSVLASDEYVGGLAAYESWPGTCLVQGFAVVATHHKDLAIKVRDRWVEDAASRLVWRAEVHDAPTFDAR
ncbi:MAG TPA: hypothetical protein VGM56_05745 [Byssovorax sp.]|jgi:hypothetical protein